MKLTPEETKIAQQKFVEIADKLSHSDGQSAMALIHDNRDLLFAFDPEKTLRANFELRFLLGQFDEAYEDLSYYAALPYVSQAVEEILRDLPKLIRANELASHKGEKFNETEAHAALSDGEDPYAVMGVLQALRERDITPFLEEIKDLLHSGIHDDVKTFALLLLVAKGIQGEVLLIKRDKAYRLDLAKLGNPWEAEEHIALKKEISALKDLGLGNVCLQLLDQLTLAYYPERLYLSNDDKDDFLEALKSLALTYLGNEEKAPSNDKQKEILSKMKLALSQPPLL